MGKKKFHMLLARVGRDGGGGGDGIATFLHFKSRHSATSKFLSRSLLPVPDAACRGAGLRLEMSEGAKKAASLKPHFPHTSRKVKCAFREISYA